MIRRLPTFNWLDIKKANRERVDGLYEEDYQLIGIDPRLGDKKLIKTIIHELLHYLSSTYPKIIKSLKEKEIIMYTNEILEMIKKNKK